MADTMEIDDTGSRGTKRKAEESLAIAQAPKRIKVLGCRWLLEKNTDSRRRLLIRMSSTRLPLEKSSWLLCML